MNDSRKRILSFSPPTYLDLNRRRFALYTAIAGFGTLIFVISAVWSALLIQNPSGLLWWGAALIMWLSMWFYDGSFSVPTRRYEGSRRRINPMNMLIGRIPPVDFEEYAFQHEFAVIQNTVTGTVFIHAGLRLATTSIHIRPNITDLLRRLYQDEQSIPLTLRINLDSSNSPAPGFSYSLIFSKRLEIPTRTALLNLLRKADGTMTLLRSMIETEYPHYGFEDLGFDELMDILRGNTGKMDFTEDIPAKSLIIKVLISSIPPLAAGIIGIGLVLKFFPTDSPAKAGLWIISAIFFGITAVQRFLANSFLIRHRRRPFQLYPLFPPETTFHDRGLRAPVIINESHNQQTIPYDFTFRTFHRAFRFQPIKFYRNLIYHLNHLSQRRIYRISASIEVRFRRIIPENLSRFRSALSGNFRYLWENRVERRETYTRAQAGFYGVQILLRISFHYGLFGAVRPAEMEQDLQQILQNIKSSFPQCALEVVRRKFNYDFHLKNFHFARLFGSLPLHIFTGRELVPFLQVPDEIHKSLPMHYAGEFSTPFLNDDILLGHTVNPENMRLESEGGISWADLENNIIITGDDPSIIDRSWRALSLAVMDYTQPCLVFDRDGSLSTTLSLHRSDNPNVHVFSVGAQIGIHLFQLPGQLNGGILQAYQTRLGQILQNIFKWPHDQITLLKALWRRCDPALSSISAEEIAGNIEIKDSSRYRQQLFDFLGEVGADEMPMIFQQDILSRIGMETLINSHNSIIIDLSPLKVPAYQDLFIHAFLTQLAVIWENLANVRENIRGNIIQSDLQEQEKPDEPGQKSIPKIIFIPQWERFLPWVKKDTDMEGLSFTFTRLLKHGFSFVGATSRLDRVDGGTLNYFKNIFAYRTQQPSSLKLLHNLLNIDQTYTNTFTRESRKASYQEKVLQSLRERDCMVYRASKRFPYIFRFDWNNFFVRECEGSYDSTVIEVPVLEEKRSFNQSLDQSFDKSFNQSINITSNQNPNQSSDSTRSTYLNFDFSGQPDLVPILEGFLEHIDAVLDYYSVLSPAALLNELLERANDYMRTHQVAPPQQAAKCRDWIDRLERTGYLEQTTFTGGAGVDLTGYVTTAKTKMMLSEKLQKSKMSQSTNQSTNQSSNQSPNQSINHSSNQNNTNTEYNSFPTHLPIYPRQHGDGSEDQSDTTMPSNYGEPDFLEEVFFDTADELEYDNQEPENDSSANKKSRATESTENRNDIPEDNPKNRPETLTETHFDRHFENTTRKKSEEWKESLRQRLMSALVQARMNMMHQKPAQALRELRKVLLREIDGLADHEGSESVFQDCWHLARKAEEVEKMDEIRLETVQEWLDEFEIFVIGF